MTRKSFAWAILPVFLFMLQGCGPLTRLEAVPADKTLQAQIPGIPNVRYWVQPVLESITLEQVDQKGRSLGRKFRSAPPRLRRSLLRYLRNDRQFTRSTFDQLSRMFPEFAAHAVSPADKWFVQVTEVEPQGEALTLDLEIEGNHTYLANGCVSHNTRRGANMGVLRIDRGRREHEQGAQREADGRVTVN